MLAVLALLALAQMTPGVVVDPDQAGATPHWTVTLSAPYCGGYRIGDGVYLRPEAPLGLPDAPPPDGSVLFQGQPGSVSVVGDALRISPAPGTLFSQVCVSGERPLSVEVLPEAGLSLPANAGSYAVDLWTGANPEPAVLPFDVPDPNAPTQ
jgi:hypothetical protein